MDHGFTNDKNRIAEVRAWRDAAIADGWASAPTYGERESIDRACKMMRDGFVATCITREKAGSWAYEASLSVWGPDGKSIRLRGPNYNFDEILAGLRSCNNCGATDVETHCYSFAGRCCAACLPAMREKSERPGWDM
jgi:hypothetical protein